MSFAGGVFEGTGEIAKFGGNVAQFVHPIVAARLAQKVAATRTPAR